MDKYFSTVYFRIWGKPFPIDEFKDKLYSESEIIFSHENTESINNQKNLQKDEQWKFEINSDKIKFSTEQLNYVVGALNKSQDTIMILPQKG